MIHASFFHGAMHFEDDFAEVGVAEVAVDLSAELAGAEDLQGARDVHLRVGRNLEGRFTLRTEAGVDVSAFGEANDFDDLRGWVSESKKDFSFGLAPLVVELVFFLVKGAEGLRQGIVVEPTSEGEE